MSTKKLAKKLGLLRQRSHSSSGLKKTLESNQIFSHLIVIDFESTCWREKKNCSQEIIEFPAVLLNTSTGEVESEFHAYVQPQEHPILSEFCTELTGITQMQVEAGIPLQICLSQFGRWLQKLQLQMGVVFPNREQRCSAPSTSQKLCTFLTWSDWDLGVCLQYECKRKQIHKPDVLNSWIDLRSTYRLFYNRKPKGLNGALQDLGIQFCGREHSGLDDARNTAQLAVRMMRDGCVMKITRSLEKTPSMARHTFEKTNCPNNNKSETCNTTKEENTANTSEPSSSKTPRKAIKSSSGIRMKVLNTEENSDPGSAPARHSLISPKTLLNSATTPLWGRSSRMTSVTAKVTNLSSSVVTSPHNNNSHVLCSTIVGCLSHLPQQSHTSTTGTVELETAAELIVDNEDAGGSYDDVVLEVEDVRTDTDGAFEFVSEFDCGYEWEEADESCSPANQITFRDNTRELVSSENIIKTSEASKSTIMKVHVSGQLNKPRQNSLISQKETYFAVPTTVSWRSNQQKTGVKTRQLQEKPDVPIKITKIQTPSSIRPQTFVPDRTSTPITSFFRPKATITQNTKLKKTPHSSFTIYSDAAQRASAASRPSSCGSRNIPKNVLSSLSTNTSSWSANHSSIPAPAKGRTITSPLCSCGRRAKRLVVSNGGPNQGRGFYCCAVRRSGSGSRMQKGCEFFKWESSLMKSSLASIAVGSSVSLCQMNSTLSCRPLPKSSLRKSC